MTIFVLFAGAANPPVTPTSAATVAIAARSTPTAPHLVPPLTGPSSLRIAVTSPLSRLYSYAARGSLGFGDQLVQRARAPFEQVVDLLGAGDREAGRVEETDLHQQRPLVPVDVLV